MDYENILLMLWFPHCLYISSFASVLLILFNCISSKLCDRSSLHSLNAARELACTLLCACVNQRHDFTYSIVLVYLFRKIVFLQGLLCTAISTLLSQPITDWLKDQWKSWECAHWPISDDVLSPILVMYANVTKVHLHIMNMQCWLSDLRSMIFSSRSTPLHACLLRFFFPPLSPSLSPLAMYEPQYYSTYETYKPKSHSIVPSSLAFSRVSNGARFFGTKYTTEDKCWLEFWRLWTIDKGELIINHRLIVIFACLV